MHSRRRETENGSVRATRRVKALWIVGSIVLVLGGYGSLAGLALSVQATADDFAERATQEFPGDPVEALMSFVQSENHSLAERSQAVRALGQLGSPRALPVLTRFHTGRACEHSKFLCQRELRKAIDRCSGRNWAPKWLPFFPRPVL